MALPNWPGHAKMDNTVLVRGNNQTGLCKEDVMSVTSNALDSSNPLTAMPLAMAAVDVSAEVLAEARRLGLAEQLPLVVQLTRELFGDLSIGVERDAEIDHWSDLVFSVRATGSMEEILDLNTQWHRRLPHATTEARGAFCLSIDEQP